MKDVEILLRSFALLLEAPNYRSPMTRFLNQFSKKSKSFTDESLPFFQKLFETFCENMVTMNPTMFVSKNGKFSITVFESIFVALCKGAVESTNIEIKPTTIEKIEALKNNTEFISASQDNTAGKTNVDKRLKLAKEILV
jgi:hypothetical protein